MQHAVQIFRSVWFMGGCLLFLMCNGQHVEQTLNASETASLIQSDLVSLSDETKSLIGLEAITATKKMVNTIISATGKVNAHPNKMALVGPIVSGRVSKLYVNPGSDVKKGDPLVQIESVDLGKAQSEYYEAKTNFELIQANHNRTKNLFGRRIGPRKDLMQMEAELKKSRTNFLAAEKQLHLMGLSEEDVRALPAETHEIDIKVNLTAPIDGTVIDRNAVIGEQVNNESMLVQIVDMRMVCVVADIYESDIARIQLGQKVRVTVPSFPEEVFEGEVKFISSQFNDETHTVPVRIEVTNKDHWLKIGMFANVSITTSESKLSLTIPKEAALKDQKETIAFVKEKENFRKRIVTTGIEYNGHIEVLTGINEGDVVVTKGNFQLLSELHGRTFSVEHGH